MKTANNHSKSGPARAGLFIYAKDLDRLINFYEAVLGAVLIHRVPELAVLQSPDIQLVIYQLPPDRCGKIEVANPPHWRESALKFFFTVQSIVDATVIAIKHGGGVDSEQWQGSGFVVRNAYDPEGNVFHIRELLD